MRARRQATPADLAARQTNRELMKEMRTRWAALPETERAIIDAYADDTAGLADQRAGRPRDSIRKPVSESVRWYRRTHFLLNDPPMTAAAYVAARRACTEEDERRAREWDAKREEERRARFAAASAAFAQKLDAMRAALARGESVPARYRPVAAHCAMCGKPLQDPQSVRLGIGPDCRRRLQTTATTATDRAALPLEVAQ